MMPGFPYNKQRRICGGDGMTASALGLVVRRVAEGGVTLLLVLVLTFCLIRVLPGGPFQDPKVPAAMRAALEARYELDAPVWRQLLRYTGQVVRGDLGPSMVQENRSVGAIIQEGWWASVGIGLPALILGGGLGAILGAVAALLRLPGVAGVLSLGSMICLATPSFIASGVLVLIFSLGLGWLPAAAIEGTVAHYVLPVVALGLSPLAFAFFLVRTAVVEVREQAFVVFKRSSGVSGWRIALMHVLRNAWLPLVSVLGPLAANILTGSFAVETIFAVPGLGRHFVHAVMNRDYTLVMGITLLYSAVLIALNTVSELALLRLDPRLRQSRA